MANHRCIIVELVVFLSSFAVLEAFVFPTSAFVGRNTNLHVSTEQTPLFVDQTAGSKQASVQNYYGNELQSSDDLKTNACCTSGAPPDHIQEGLKRLHPVTIQKYYGCGLCLPSYDMTGLSVLDLGCGAGRDVYLASQLTGPTGRVVGIDMTPAQLETAKEYQGYHAEQFGYQNTEFYYGYLETLDQVKELEPNSFDLIISNCVINLCTDKQAVLKACHDLLRPGGELYFSDVYASRRVPTSLQNNEVLWGECLSGALYWNDFLNIAKSAGFVDPRLVEDSPIVVKNKQIEQAIHDAGCAAIEFFSSTYRLFKMRPDLLEPDCEDYGQAVRYKGTIPRATSGWRLDKHHIFETGQIFPVCGNTYNMLRHCPRLAEHFDFYGDFSKHYGIFSGCGKVLPFDSPSASTSSKRQDSSQESSVGPGCC